MSVIKTSTNTVVKTVEVGGQLAGVAISPNGRDAYVTNSGSGTASVIKISTNTVVATVAVGPATHTGSPSPPTGATPNVTNLRPTP